MKTILYIHGYQSKPNKEKVELLKSFGFDVIAPHIDYDKEQHTIYNELTKAKFDFVIGSSLGGYLADKLSFDKPAILINPSFIEKEYHPTIPKNINKKQSSTRIVCIGVYDDVVRPSDTIKYIDSNNHIDYKTKNFEFGHRVSFSDFKKIIQEHLSVLGIK